MYSGILSIGKAPTPKWMLPRWIRCPYGHRLTCWQTGEAFLFLLVPLIEKGKKRNNQASKGRHPVMGTFLMAFAMLFIIPFICLFFKPLFLIVLSRALRQADTPQTPPPKIRHPSSSIPRRPSRPKPALSQCPPPRSAPRQSDAVP